MSALVMKVEEVTKRIGINVIAKKSENLDIGRGVSDVRLEDVQLRGQAMKEVDGLTYLRSMMISNGKFTQDVDSKITLTSRLIGTFRRRLRGMREVNLKVKNEIFNGVVLSVVFYGATACELTEPKKQDWMR